MKKQDVIELYNHIKKKRRLMDSSNIITKRTKTNGCKSCGRVTWKPNQ